jgi:hypothetical protein
LGNNRLGLMGEYNDALDEIRTGIYRLLEFEEEDFSEKKSLAKREVQFMINDLRIKIENL